MEECLWRADTWFDHDRMERILGDDFVGFGRSGCRCDRAAILAAAPEGINIDFPLRDFGVRLLHADLALITVVSGRRHDGEEERSLRVSIWTCQIDGWLLDFHQGTALPGQ